MAKASKAAAPAPAEEPINFDDFDTPKATRATGPELPAGQMAGVPVLKTRAAAVEWGRKNLSSLADAILLTVPTGFQVIEPWDPQTGGRYASLPSGAERLDSLDGLAPTVLRDRLEAIKRMRDEGRTEGTFEGRGVRFGTAANVERALTRYQTAYDRRL